MNNIEFEIKMSQHHIKILRKSLCVHTCLIIMNLGLIIFHGYKVYHSNLISNGIGFGCFLVNMVWSLLFFIDSLQDIIIEKRRLNFLNQHKDNSQEYYM